MSICKINQKRKGIFSEFFVLTYLNKSQIGIFFIQFTSFYLPHLSEFANWGVY
jgi:hypothetical protein